MAVRRLSSRVTLQSPPAGPDSHGEESGSWTTVAIVFADIRHLNGLETIKGSADVSVVKCSIRLNYRADVLPSWRVVFGAKTYEVKAVLPEERKRWLDLACELVQ